LTTQAFQSRGLSSKVLQGLGIKHTKGVLLYGPPGSGKTLVARTVAKLLGTEKVTLVNTPMIMQKFLGESEKVLQKYFEPAEKEFKEKGANSDVHIVIFDEIDAIFRERGRGDGSAANMAYDSVVNALLTKMDGLEQADNLVVIAMTNRKELLDPALLRPGRFEVQIEIGLPKEEGRKQIMAIHTHQMRESGLVAEGVDFDAIATELPRVSGAEIAGLVRNAASFAVDRVMAASAEGDDGNTIVGEGGSSSSSGSGSGTSGGGGDGADLRVTPADIHKAVAALKPSYDIDEAGLALKHLPYGVISEVPSSFAVCTCLVAVPLKGIHLATCILSIYHHLTHLQWCANLNLNP
jgi:vesicle-fusing ATPase